MKDKSAVFMFLFIVAANIFCIYAMYQTTLDHRKNMEYARSIDMPDSYWLQEEYKKMYISNMGSFFPIYFMDFVFIMSVHAVRSSLSNASVEGEES